ncbi:MAG: beta-lactamase family protein, partial [Hyphomonadaceae bacterium]|nr:beta-lactamase family protein [Hyphomonadaceae bacterium]
MPTAISPLTQASLAEAVANAARQYYCPGLSAAVYVNGETMCATAGVLNLATQEPVTPHALFQIGSVSKLVTAALVMQLVEAGKIGLDQSVSALLGGAPIGKGEFSARVTVRHLLTHMSGQDGDLFEDTGRDDDCIARNAVLCRDLDFLCAPGLHYNYCNAGYCLLGRIVETQTGVCFEEAA